MLTRNLALQMILLFHDPHHDDKCVHTNTIIKSLTQGRLHM